MTTFNDLLLRLNFQICPSSTSISNRPILCFRCTHTAHPNPLSPLTDPLPRISLSTPLISLCNLKITVNGDGEHRDEEEVVREEADEQGGMAMEISDELGTSIPMEETQHDQIQFRQ